MADVVKYGIQIPNRVFVGGVAFDTKEDELKDFFSQYGKVKECKIIKDNQSISRGFAFVTFECKHDAIQTQQLGTVFFKQKKLNLGPAIRQKGVVFNNSAEYENEPVLSTGVYVHPSGYSYTVAPNGVWYFHNADGSPRPRQRGSPAMSYSPTLVKEIQQTTQEYQSMSASSSIVHTVPTESESYDGSESPVPYSFPSTVEAPETPYQMTQVIENQMPVHSTSCVQHTHSTIGSSNIHVAFQNMSISSHTAAAPPTPPNAIPNHHLHFAATTRNLAPPPSYATHAHSTIQAINTPLPQSPLVPTVQYTRFADMFVPYYAPNVKSAFEGSTYEHQPPHPGASCHYQVPLQPRPEYYSMMPPPVDARDNLMYPVYNAYHPAVVYPTPPCGTSPSIISPPSSSPYWGFRKHNARNTFKGTVKYEADGRLKVDTKCA